MPGTAVAEDVEILIEDIGGGGGGKEPPAGGDGGGDGDKRRRPSRPSPNRYSTAIILGIVSILMFFMALTSAFIVLRGASAVPWVPVRLPSIVWVNSVVLLASSATLELARRRLASANALAFRKLWLLTTSLGVLFLVGQLIAWRQLVARGIYVATTQASSFFYIFTAAHGLHLLGGVTALLYVAVRNFDKANLTRSKAAEITSYYWHFMDGLWVFLLALLYFGK
jgi:cytochrome c oxidase subunit III